MLTVHAWMPASQGMRNITVTPGAGGLWSERQRPVSVCNNGVIYSCRETSEATIIESLSPLVQSWPGSSQSCAASSLAMVYSSRLWLERSYAGSPRHERRTSAAGQQPSSVRSQVKRALKKCSLQGRRHLRETKELLPRDDWHQHHRYRHCRLPTPPRPDHRQALPHRPP